MCIIKILLLYGHIINHVKTQKRDWENYKWGFTPTIVPPQMTEHKDLLAGGATKSYKTDIKAQKLYTKAGYMLSHTFIFSRLRESDKSCCTWLDMSTAKDTFNMRHNIFKLHRKTFDAKRQNQLGCWWAKALPFMETSGLIETKNFRCRLSPLNNQECFLIIWKTMIC